MRKRSASACIARLEAVLGPKEAVRAFVTEAIERSLDDKNPRDWMLGDSALELAPHFPEVGEEIANRLDEIQAFFCRAIAAAQTEGSVPTERDAGDMALLLLGALLGIHVLARSKPERTLLEGLARPALALLDYPLSKRGAKR